MTALPALEDRVLRFLELSQDILSLIGHENAILLEKGELSFEAYVMRKVDLMNNFEKEARNLLGLLSEGAAKMNAQAIMINEIRRVRDALKVNSGYQLGLIRQSMKENFSGPAGELAHSAATHGESACH
jgi:hypothetical protein